MLEGDIWELGRLVSYKTSLKRCEKKPGVSLLRVAQFESCPSKPRLCVDQVNQINQIRNSCGLKKKASLVQQLVLFIPFLGG